ncbi:solute carrier organic anion transporter family member 4C1-like [Colias croceus]|uniref:solute carrier organic anion transporter family member 4C1-like n=1 Tax=Colias crocea TaxID=72248 RepID=UPI001E27A911|nr:solute carrier organic anion transporter family member 4C1-like [Colias croceus]
MVLYGKAKAKVQSWHKVEIVPKDIRGITMGNIMNITVAECCLFKIIMQDVKAGTLPGYSMYLLIPVVSIMEALLAPLVAWLGYKTRRTTILRWSLGIMIISSLWVFLPSPPRIQETEFCNSTIINQDIEFTHLSLRTTFRLVITVGMAICFALARVASWSHVVAYMDDIAPDRMSVHVGILICARIIVLLFNNLLVQGLDRTILITLGMLTIFTLLNTLRLFFGLPKVTQDTGDLKLIPMNDRGYFRSLKRVLFNFVAMSQMISMGLVAAALWGFGYYEHEIIKTNFNIMPIIGNNINDSTKFLINVVFIFAVVYMGVKQSAPIRPKFDMTKALSISFKMTFFVIILYILIVAAPPCSKGHVAGLENGQDYASPQCSLPCGCVPRFKEFSPVCVVDTMTTYVSPCEAGCTEQQSINNLRVYTNCSCASTGHAIPGACSDYNCQIGFNYHGALFSMILTVSLVAFQAHSMSILKSVDPRDKSIAIGLMWSVIAVMTFVVGNNIFYAIDLNTCSWYTGQRCQLHSDWFPYAVGITCVNFTLTALIINGAACRYLRTKRKDDVTDEPNACTSTRI